VNELELDNHSLSSGWLAKISAVYSHKLVTQPNFPVLTEHIDAADVDFN